jgi:2-keto-4-pentenoate hydratase
MTIDEGCAVQRARARLEPTDGRALRTLGFTLFEVLAGSFTRPTTAARGDTLHADYGALGSISFRWV